MDIWTVHSVAKILSVFVPWWQNPNCLVLKKVVQKRYVLGQKLTLLEQNRAVLEKKSQKLGTFLPVFTTF